MCVSLIYYRINGGYKMKIEELEKKTETELKAIVYDLLVAQQDNTRELQLINNLIAKKELEGKEK